MAGDFPASFTVEVEYSLGIFVEFLPRSGKKNSTTLPLEQRFPEGFFESLNALTDRRLAQSKHLRRPGGNLDGCAAVDMRVIPVQSCVVGLVLVDVPAVLRPLARPHPREHVVRVEAIVRALVAARLVRDLERRLDAVESRLKSA